MKRFPGHFLILLAAVLLTTSLLSGCGLLLGQTAPQAKYETAADGSIITPVPTATKDPAGFQAVNPEACKIADWTTMQSNQDQGDQLAWQPNTHNLAYLTPADRSSWFVGTLMLAKGPDYSKRVQLALNTLAAGGLTWSPSGEKLAFLAFRASENLYTVMVVNADGSGLVDLFPLDTARTDSRTSMKAVLGWKDENTLEVMTSCGEECRQAYDVQVNPGSQPVLTPTPIDNYRQLGQALKVHRSVLQKDEKDLPRNLTSPSYSPDTRLVNWSPDESMVTYLDKRGVLWIMKPATKTNYIVDIGLRDVDETRWSDASDQLAIRAEDRIFIFAVPCNQH